MGAVVIITPAALTSKYISMLPSLICVDLGEPVNLTTLHYVECLAVSLSSRRRFGTGFYVTLLYTQLVLRTADFSVTNQSAREMCAQDMLTNCMSLQWHTAIPPVLEI